MVKFVQKLDRNNKVYLVKPLRQAGLVNKIEIVPNAKAAIIYAAGTPLRDILESMQIIMADLRHRAKTEKEPKNERRKEN